MKRRLQIIVSVVFATIAVALCVLWIRSYLVLQETIVTTVGNHTYYAEISRGKLKLGISPPHPSEDRWDTLKRGQVFSIRGWQTDVQWTRPGAVRYWYFVVVAMLIAALPWMRSRFSLRTLLIVTTIVALVIGLTIATS